MFVRDRLARSRLYLVLAGADAPVLEPALRGGVDIVQLRDKELSDEALVAAAEPFRAACDAQGALFVLNDRPDLVEACGADGVHVGRSDMPVAEARVLVGADRLLGLSVSTLGELGDVAGADYVGVTAFATPTKEDAVAGGLGLLACRGGDADGPWFAIGGVDLAERRRGVQLPARPVLRLFAPSGTRRPGGGGTRLRAVLDR